MRKITLAFLLLSSFTILFAQAPQKMNYQSVIRKTDGTLLSNTLIGIRTSVLFGSETGTASYVETQTTTTNPNGLATIVIGGGTPVTGTFTGINWGAGTHFIKTEIDPAGGTNYTISGTSQLLSVPYALYAGSSVNNGKASILISGDISDAEALAQIQAESGPYTENIYVVNTTNLTTLDFSSLKRIVNLNISDNVKLTTVKFGALAELYGDLQIENNESLSSLVFPALKVIYGYDISVLSNSALRSISFPTLTSCRSVYFTYNGMLSSIDMPLLNSLYLSQSSIVLSNNALPSSQINLILSRLLNVKPITKKYVQLSNQNPLAPPTGQGILDKATLQSMGNNIDTD